MIDRSEILEIATDLSLSPDVIEKDYVLGWLLAGINQHEDLAAHWIFKGGTCLKKCYFETYRFSEDLDFTVTDSAQLDREFLNRAFRQVVEWVYDETGVEIPAAQSRFEVYRNKRDGLSCEGRVYYNGPLQRVSSLPRIKLDLTLDELVVLPAVDRLVGHPYSDLPEQGITARCYAYEEVFGEKIRALGERTRPRDLYDVVNLFRHGEFKPAASVILDILRRKCEFKGIVVPTLETIARNTEELLGDWQTMLGHQLPALPPFETFWSVLPDFFEWLHGAVLPPEPFAAPIAAGEQLFSPPVGLLRRQRISGSSFLETIRFAAANRLCIDLVYQQTTRRIEPYSLRRTEAGAILLFAVRSEDAQVRSYRLDQIQGAQITSQNFTPRYAVELTPAELGSSLPSRHAMAMGSVFSSSESELPSLGVRRTTAPPSSRKTGPTYVYECRVCGKKFRRSKRDPKMNEHNTPDGRRCSGRIGYLVDTRY